MPSGRTLLAASSLLVCSGCLTNIRPTVTGQVVDATTGRMVPGVAVSIDDITNSVPVADPRANTVTGADGQFSSPGAQRLDLWSGYIEAFTIRFHQDGYNDMTYDFLYEAHIGLLGDRKPIGRILLRPASASNQPAN